MATLSPSAQVKMARVLGLHCWSFVKSGENRRESGLLSLVLPGFPTIAGELVCLTWGLGHLWFSPASSLGGGGRGGQGGTPGPHYRRWSSSHQIHAPSSRWRKAEGEQRPPHRHVFRIFCNHCPTALPLLPFPQEQRHPPDCQAEPTWGLISEPALQGSSLCRTAKGTLSPPRLCLSTSLLQ